MKNISKKFNLIDALVIFIIIAVMLVGWLFINNRSEGGNSSAFTYDILLKEIPIETAEAITHDADVFDGIKIINIGKILEFSYDKSVRYEFSEETGEYVYTEIPDMYDATIKVIAEGGMNGLSHCVNDYEIYVGKSVDIKSVGFVGHGVIVSVDEVN